LAIAHVGEAELQGEGDGSSKKTAEASAARALYARIVSDVSAVDPELVALVQAPMTRPSGLRARPVDLPTRLP
jgi:hypothetical protein